MGALQGLSQAEGSAVSIAGEMPWVLAGCSSGAGCPWCLLACKAELLCAQLVGMLTGLAWYDHPAAGYGIELVCY